MYFTTSLKYLKGILVLLISQDLLQRTSSVPRRRFSSGDIRLVGGRSRYEGTVLIYHNRRWGSICDRRWDISDADVVCKQLGYGRALQSIRSSRFGIGRRRMWMSYLQCRGYESRLTRCRHPGWGIRYDYRYCTRSRRRSAGVVCSPPPEPVRPRRPRITSTPKPTTTTPKPTTTTPKPTTTTPKPTTTTTKPTTTTTKPTTTTPKPTTTTQKPTTTTPKPTTTTPKPTTTTPKPTTTTPKPTTTTPKPTTTTPKPTITTPKPTTTTPKPTTTTPKPTTTTSVPPTTSTEKDIDIDVTINEILDSTRYSILQNSRNGSSLQYDEEWSGRRRTLTTTTTTRRPTTPKPTTPRPTTRRPTTQRPTTRRPTTRRPTTRRPVTLRPTRPAPSSTMVDLDVDLPVGEWYRDKVLKCWVLRRRGGSIRLAFAGRRLKKVTYEEYIDLRREKLGISADDDHMKSDDPQASSASSQPSEQVNTGTIQTSSNNSISLTSESSGSNNVNVEIGSPGKSRTQTNMVISSNRHRHGHRNREREPDRNIGSNTKLQIRRGGNRYRNRGRIEVLPPGKSKWGVICGDDWTIKETIVACKHLRLGYAHQAVTTSQFGGHDMIKYYSSIKCTGRESRLQDCRWIDHEGPIRCKRPTSVAGIVCTRSLPDLVPSIEMLETTVFLQDRPLYYLQCAMEEKCLGASAYAIQGTRGWMSATRRLLRFSSVVANKGTADFKPALDRSQWEWHACHMHYHSMDIFAHYDIMDYNGNRVAEGLKASFCLEDSECNRGVYPKYSCTNYGQQGISVGCSDNYMSDIDCQWIDITDLKAGKYKFKLEVNPKMIVAEISFENNVIACDLEYTGYNARIHNCDHKSLL